MNHIMDSVVFGKWYIKPHVDKWLRSVCVFLEWTRILKFKPLLKAKQEGWRARKEKERGIQGERRKGINKKKKKKKEGNKEERKRRRKEGRLSG